jgi:leucine-rich repeat protein SHOC2
MKCVSKNLDSLSLCGMRLAELPNFFDIGSQLTELLEINLSNNNLFNGRKVFEILSQLQKLRRLNLCHNSLNGCLDELAGNIITLEELRLDSNQLTALPTNVGRWKALKIFTANDNSLQGTICVSLSLTLTLSLHRLTRSSL